MVEGVNDDLLNDDSNYLNISRGLNVVGAIGVRPQINLIPTFIHSNAFESISRLSKLATKVADLTVSSYLMASMANETVVRLSTLANQAAAFTTSAFLGADATCKAHAVIVGLSTLVNQVPAFTTSAYLGADAAYRSHVGLSTLVNQTSSFTTSSYLGADAAYRSHVGLSTLVNQTTSFTASSYLGSDAASRAHISLSTLVNQTSAFTASSYLGSDAASRAHISLSTLVNQTSAFTTSSYLGVDAAYRAHTAVMGLSKVCNQLVGYTASTYGQTNLNGNIIESSRPKSSVVNREFLIAERITNEIKKINHDVNGLKMSDTNVSYEVEGNIINISIQCTINITSINGRNIQIGNNNNLNSYECN